MTVLCTCGAAGFHWCTASERDAARRARTFTQREVIALSGVMISATSRCSQIGAGLAGRRGSEALYSEIADELREIRDALTMLPVNGPAPIPF